MVQTGQGQARGTYSQHVLPRNSTPPSNQLPLQALAGLPEPLLLRDSNGRMPVATPPVEEEFASLPLDTRRNKAKTTLLSMGFGEGDDVDTVLHLTEA